MAKKKGKVVYVRMLNPKTGTSYITKKNRTNTQDPLKMKKFDKKTGKHENFEERKLK